MYSVVNVGWGAFVLGVNITSSQQQARSDTNLWVVEVRMSQVLYSMNSLEGDFC